MDGVYMATGANRVNIFFMKHKYKQSLETTSGLSTVTHPLRVRVGPLFVFSRFQSAFHDGAKVLKTILYFTYHCIT